MSIGDVLISEMIIAYYITVSTQGESIVFGSWPERKAIKDTRAEDTVVEIGIGTFTDISTTKGASNEVPLHRSSSTFSHVREPPKININ